jgi:membrane-bound serine protease (ClpP class)
VKQRIFTFFSARLSASFARTASMLWVVGLALSANADSPAKTPTAYLTKIEGLIHEGVVEQVQIGIEQANNARAAALIVQLDTPGGLLDSTTKIVQLILNSPLPVFVYVYPSGAQAGSAGAIITMAGHVAAMAPGTNIGAATPVSMGGDLPEDMKKKAKQHTASYIETIAEERNRNREWARKAVLEAASITAKQAEQKGVIDFVVENIPQLLERADGRIVKVNGKETAIRTKGATVKEVTLDFKQRFKLKLADPSTSFVLLILAVLGIYAEFSHPGLIVPGTIGVLSALLFLISIQILPFNALGLSLIGLGILCFVLEMKFTSYGLLTVSGLVCFATGALMLYDVPEKAFDETSAKALLVPLNLIIPATLALGVFVAGVMYAVMRVMRRSVLTANEGMVGLTGKLTAPLEGGQPGQVFLNGELWRAVSDQPLGQNEKVVVVSCEGLTLKVKKLE